MNCNNCGLSVGETAKFCNRCGAKVATSGSSPSGATGNYDQAGRPSPVTALFTDPPPPSAATTCANHTNTTAFAACVSCGHSYCRHCLINDSGKHYCRNCAARLRTPPAQQTEPYQPQPYQQQQPYQHANQPPPYQHAYYQLPYR